MATSRTPAYSSKLSDPFPPPRLVEGIGGERGAVDVIDLQDLQRVATADVGKQAGGPVAAPDPEVQARATRRRFTAEYKLRILREADACRGNGDLGMLLRREGLYSSHLSTWRRRRDAIARVSLAPKKRGRTAKAVDPRVKQLGRENARLKRRLGEQRPSSRSKKENSPETERPEAAKTTIVPGTASTGEVPPYGSQGLRSPLTMASDPNSPGYQSP